jgi:peptidylprolyl isomerase
VNKSILAAGCAAAIVLTLTACGQQTDERVATSTEPVATAEASAPAATAAPSPSGVQASVQAATPFVTLDCVSLQVMPTDRAPASGTTVGAVTALMQPNGAPAITVATDAQPATELGIADIKEGSGPAVTANDTVTANYCGVGLGGKTVFDSSYSRGTPATFPLSGVIAGWQQGVPGMKVGGSRLLVIPGALAYGPNPPGGSGIGPDETLVFVVELTAIS